MKSQTIDIELIDIELIMYMFSAKILSDESL